MLGELGSKLDRDVTLKCRTCNVQSPSRRSSVKPMFYW